MFIIISILIMLLSFYASWVYQKKNEKKLAFLAKTLGLTYDRPNGVASTVVFGNYRTIWVRVFEERRGSGKHQYIASIYRVSLNPLEVPKGLLMYREGFSSKIRKAFGGEDIQTDHQQINSKFIIKGAFAEDCNKFFAKPQVADSLMELLDICPAFRLEDNVLVLDFNKGIAVTHKHLQSRLDALTRCADAIAQPLSSRPEIPPKAAEIPPIPIEHTEDLENTYVQW